MPMAELTLENLSKLDDGRIAAAFKYEMRRAVEDCVDRTSDSKARTVNISVSLIPVISDNGGGCEDVLTEFSVKSTVPARKSKTFTMNPRKNGILTFSINNPTDPDQKHFADENPEAFKNED